MKARLLYALVASAVVTASAAAIGASVDRIPKGPARETAERYLVAPGHDLYERLESNKDFRRWRKKAEKQVDAGKEKVEEATESLQDAADRLRLPHLYNTAAWAVAGFLLCFLGTLVFGVSSLKSALALGLKATLMMLFLQGALVFAGILAYQSVKAS